MIARAPRPKRSLRAVVPAPVDVAGRGMCQAPRSLAPGGMRAKAGQARVLMLSNMRGHLCDMDALAALCAETGLTLLEDCAHTMGATWNGRKSGSFGLTGCFSTQTYKHINSGEGGLLTSDDPAFMARATILSSTSSCALVRPSTTRTSATNS